MAKRNERNTEKLVRSFFEADTSIADLVIDEQGSSDPTITRLLKQASKSGPGLGKPEFVLRAPAYPDLVVLVECKANPKMHASPGLDHPADFAADGALHPARYLSKQFDVIAIAVSGEDAPTIRVSTFGLVPRAIRVCSS